MQFEMVPRDTVEAVVRNRNAILTSYAEAYGQMAQTNDLFKDIRSRMPPVINAYNYAVQNETRGFTNTLALAPRKEYLAAATRLVDTNVWAYLVDLTGLRRIMDKQAKDELREQLISSPAEVTEENIRVTIEAWVANAKLVFMRGAANVFSNLDRRFRSHDGWKIGGRIILNKAFEENGFWNYHENHKDTLIDVERAFLTLDGKARESHLASESELIVAIDNARKDGRFCARQTFVETTYFKIRIFMNGNCHVWFKRKDLVEQVNKLLAEYYGEVLADGQDASEHDDGGLNSPKTSLAKNFGFFPTPEGAVREVLRQVDTYARYYRGPERRFLEPSAGTGNLARPLALKGEVVDCVEFQPEMARALDLARNPDRPGERLYGKVWCLDFLLLKPNPIYTDIVMNPPFDRERDIDHVVHALKFLKEGGTLVAIMSASTEFRQTKKSIAFRKMIKEMGGRFSDLPAGSFASVGTNVNTLTLRVTR